MANPFCFEWSPVLNFPWSQGLRQVVAPQTDWFFGRITGDRGDGAIEKRVFEEVASYGRQLGLITEVLLELARKGDLSKEGKESLEELEKITKRIEEIKALERKPELDRLKERLKTLRKERKEDFDKLMAEMRK